MLLGTIVLSRLYSPEEFGIYAVILGAATVASVASSFRYEMTILIPKSNLLSELGLRLSLWISVSVNLLGFFCVFFLVLFDILDPYWIVVPITSFLASIINISSFLQNRKKQYTKIASVQVMRSLLFIFLANLAYFFGYDGNGLLLAMVLSMSVVAAYLLLFDFRNANAYAQILEKTAPIYVGSKK